MNDFKDTLRCAKQGNADARYEAGLAYFNGDGVRKSHKKAAKWFKLAATQCVTEAQYLLADCYCKGDGGFRNASEAVYWYNRALEYYQREADGGDERAKKKAERIGINKDMLGRKEITIAEWDEIKEKLRKCE